MKKLAAVFAVICVTMPAAAATRTWNGSAGSAWSNAANWNGGVPANGDDLVFPNGVTNLTSTNDRARCRRHQHEHALLRVDRL